MNRNMSKRPAGGSHGGAGRTQIETEDTSRQVAQKDKESGPESRRGTLDASTDHEELHEIAWSYLVQFRHFGELDNIEKAIEYGTRALDLTPDNHPNRPRQLQVLGIFYDERFKRAGELEDLEKAIELGSHGLALTPDGHPALPSRHASLGGSYRERFWRLGELGDLEKAIEHDTRALALTPDGHPDLADRHAGLGKSYYQRFQRLGRLEDIEEEIKHDSRALALTPDNHPDLPRRYANLGVSYEDRYQRLGELNDLEKSIEYKSRALVLTPDSHPDFPRHHANLGMSYGHRFWHLGELNDLEKSIEHKSRALALIPEGHPDLADWHASLGTSYTNRFQSLGKLSDLEKSMEHESRALSLTPNGHPDLPRQHNRLGVSYIVRFRHLGEFDDLEKSIEHNACALALTPEGHPDLADCHASLALSYSDRFLHFGHLDDLETATEHDSRALELTPDGHPYLPIRYVNKALNSLLRHGHTTASSDLDHALEDFRRASQLSTGAPRIIFENALLWATRATEHSSLNCLEAYHVTMDLLPQFIWLGASTNQRYQDLSTAGNLAVGAAAAAILHSDPELALEWLEHARCVVWNQSLMLRSPVNRLQLSHPNLAVRIQEVSKQLQDASPESLTSQAIISDPVNQEQAGQLRRRLAKEYSDLLVQARRLSGFEDFLQPMKANVLAHASRYGPVVVVNCHNDRCDALIILPQRGIKHLHLPDFTEEKARNARSNIQASLRRQSLREREIRIEKGPNQKGGIGSALAALWRYIIKPVTLGCQRLGERGILIGKGPKQKDNIGTVLAVLWKCIVKPVLDFLEFTNNVPEDGLPHITWCPTGVISFLPLHAAGNYDQPRSRVFDYVVSSYTPTLTALLASTPSSFDRTTRVLAIGQANTPGHTPLPGITRELECIKAHTRNQAGYSQLLDEQATTATVLDTMEQHEWVHLACHAHQNVDDPTKSGFFLHDGILDLAAINRRSFSNKGLAFLSACQTATGDAELPDEAIHLASGMLMAGYPSVIATMWSVVDSDAPFVTDKVYAELMKDGKIGNGEAGKALHDAVAALREKVGEKAFGRWVPYIHIGS
ncbi:unnamed protein product [Rhizoctonia solani]|uniref:CHAT domain-containing protein n=1 Tax=Rhizoctonia solani TaxID=456999 RepID=A0A8H2XNL8_9AGAM|nr:unnamed protein product [Rhizoctonia solani]